MEDFKKILGHEIVLFSYRYKNPTKDHVFRVALGTRNPAIVGTFRDAIYEVRDDFKNRPLNSNEVIKYFDFMRNEWRSFTAENLVEVSYILPRNISSIGFALTALVAADKRAADCEEYRENVLRYTADLFSSERSSYLLYQETLAYQPYTESEDVKAIHKTICAMRDIFANQEPFFAHTKTQLIDLGRLEEEPTPAEPTPAPAEPKPAPAPAAEPTTHRASGGLDANGRWCMRHNGGRGLNGVSLAAGGLVSSGFDCFGTPLGGGRRGSALLSRPSEQSAEHGLVAGIHFDYIPADESEQPRHSAPSHGTTTPTTAPTRPAAEPKTDKAVYAEIARHYRELAALYEQLAK